MNKQHILDEIKRTAVANGGTPLGKQKFYRDIGIKEADWHGKYWARWGDALREAGFRPNEMQTAYADNLLIERLIDLIREVGRFPVIGELKLKARTDRTFPSHNVFARLGSKQQLAGRVFKYCTDHDGLDDVIALCTSIVHAQANIPQVEEAVSDRQSDAIARTKEGYVYMALLTLGREKRYKIGKAVLVERRTDQISLQMPEDLELVHAIRTDDAYGIEEYWHRRFAAKRTKGEWFSLSRQDISAFKRRKFM